MCNRLLGQHFSSGGKARVFVVTPCFNAAPTLAQTIASVAQGSGACELYYHVQDGGSTDGTVDILGQHERELSQDGGIHFTWNSAPDKGMYDAITRSLDSMPAEPDDFVAWINADDLLLPGTLPLVARVTLEMPEVQWLGGPQYVIEDNTPVLERDVPTPTEMLVQGLCDGVHWRFLQQEGSFFRYSLWQAGRHALQGFRLAGDWSLWREFAKHAVLHQCRKPLGAFRRREGQLSVAGFEKYMREVDTALAPEERERAFAALSRGPELCRLLVRERFGRLRVVRDYRGVRKEFRRRLRALERRRQGDMNG